MGQKNIKKFLLYLLRWQLSTPIIWLVVRNLGTGLYATIIANFIGGCIFFWIDKLIFKPNKPEIWYLKKGKCNKCHQSSDLYQIIKTKSHSQSKYLCAKCSLEEISPIRTNTCS